MEILSWNTLADIMTTAIHVGTNNIIDEDPSIILHRNRYLLKNIWKTNPSTKIQVKFDIPPLKPKGGETHVVSNKRNDCMEMRPVSVDEQRKFNKIGGRRSTTAEIP